MSTKVKQYEKDTKAPYLFRHVATGIFYVRRRRKGKKPLNKSTGESVRVKARTKADAMIQSWLDDKPITYRDQIQFGPFALKYLEHIETSTKLKPRTKEQARIYIKILVEHLGFMAITEISEGFFDEWIEEFKHKSDRATFADYAKYLSKTLRHAHAKGVINRMPKIRNPDPKKKTGRLYTHDEAFKMLGACNIVTELQFRLSLQCFMRLREVLGLKWERVNLETGLIILNAEDVKTGSQTGEGRSLFVNQEVLDLLIARRKIVKGSPFIFPSPQDPHKHQWENRSAWKKVKQDAGITGKARWHDLRHTALTWALIEKKMNPILVSKYAGVSVRTIERVYLKVSATNTKEVSGAIDI